MPTYEYKCDPCDDLFDVTKPVSSLNDLEPCPKCGSINTKRQISRTHCYGISDWDKKEWNPGLGCFTKGTKDRDRKAKAKGLLEVGNESLEKTMAYHDRCLNDRLEEATKDSYDALTHGIKKEYLARR